MVVVTCFYFLLYFGLSPAGTFTVKVILHVTVLWLFFLPILVSSLARLDVSYFLHPNIP